MAQFGTSIFLFLWTIEVVSPAKSTPLMSKNTIIHFVMPCNVSAFGAHVGSFAPPVPLSDGLDNRPCKILDPPLHFREQEEEFTTKNEKCLKTMEKYTKDHLPLTNASLCDLQCLHPSTMKSEGGRSAIGRLCSHLRKVTKTDQHCDSVCSEWLLYSTDSVIVTVSPSNLSWMCLLTTHFHDGRHC